MSQEGLKQEDGAGGGAWAQRAAQARAWEAERRQQWDDLDRRLRAVAKARGAVDAREAELLRDAEELQLWRGYGYASLLEYMERAMGYAPHTAGERLRVAKALVELPRIAEALEKGEIKHSAVRELTRVVSSDTEAEWLGAVRDKSLREIEALIAGRKQGSRPGDRPEPSLRRRRLTLDLQPEIYEMFRQAQAALAEVQGHRLSPEELIAAMCRIVLEPAKVSERQEGPGPDGRGAGRPAYQLAIKTCPDCKRSWQYGGGRDIEIGAPVVERARCDAEHIGSLDAEAPDRKTTTLTKRLRKHIFARDGYVCRVPGCRRVIGLDIHHIQFQEHGGGHEPWNLVLTCSSHHAAVHDGKLAISGRAPDSVRFVFTRGHARFGIEDLGPNLSDEDGARGSSTWDEMGGP
ncbi:MAG TPA: HNH endonuclease signature motif containing protein [Kofleriaceae bacterium]|nr:HNH endonuclease signature motif containing protein [Kofleriaceae bacterium]